MPNGNNVGPTTSDSVNQQIADQVSEAQDVYDALNRFANTLDSLSDGASSRE